MSSIPLSDAPALRRAIERTDALRIALAALLLALVGALALLAGQARVRTLHLLPPGSTAIVALDLSASVSQDTYARIGATLWISRRPTAATASSSSPTPRTRRFHPARVPRS